MNIIHEDLNLESKLLFSAIKKHKFRILLFSQVVSQIGFMCSIWLLAVYVVGATPESLGKLFTAPLSVSWVTLFAMKGASEREEWGRRGQEGRRGAEEEKSGIIWHSRGRKKISV